jgi:hypothetical protein
MPTRIRSCAIKPQKKDIPRRYRTLPVASKLANIIEVIGIPPGMRPESKKPEGHITIVYYFSPGPIWLRFFVITRWSCYRDRVKELHQENGNAFHTEGPRKRAYFTGL